MKKRKKNLDDLYENDLYIGQNVNLLQPIPDKSVKGDSQNTLTLEYCKMSLEDFIKRQLDKPLEIHYIIHLSAQIISAVKFCHEVNKIAIRNLTA